MLRIIIGFLTIPIIIFGVFSSLSAENTQNTEFVASIDRFSLNGWKLQIPGPKDIYALYAYASQYFYLNKQGEMVFSLDSSEKGSTKNSVFVRSELRHLSNWYINRNCSLIATLRVESNLSPDKVTVLKIHGYVEKGIYAPTLVRIALNDGDLYAYLNKSNHPKDTKRFLLLPDIENNTFRCVVSVINKKLIIKVNEKERFRHNISYWKYKNYFKAGCYPQAHKGKVKVFFSELVTRQLNE
jgi:hypothetical protein